MKETAAVTALNKEWYRLLSRDKGALAEAVAAHKMMTKRARLAWCLRFINVLGALLLLAVTTALVGFQMDGRFDNRRWLVLLPMFIAASLFVLALLVDLVAFRHRSTSLSEERQKAPWASRSVLAMQWTSLPDSFVTQTVHFTAECANQLAAALVLLVAVWTLARTQIEWRNFIEVQPATTEPKKRGLLQLLLVLVEVVPVIVIWMPVVAYVSFWAALSRKAIVRPHIPLFGACCFVANYALFMRAL